MGLEVTTTIGGLVATNPVAGVDAVSEGDDHFRLLKTVLKTTFPNLNGVWNASVAEANRLVGLSSAIEQQGNKNIASGYLGLDATAHALKANQHAQTAYLDATANFVGGLQVNGIPVVTTAYGGLLAAIQAVDGAGSGIDADFLDGFSSASFVLNSVYTAADVFNKVLTLDGAGSALDADLLDGLQGTSFVKVANNLSDVAALPARTNLGLAIGVDVLAPNGVGTALTALNGTNITSGTVAKARIDADVYRGALGSGNITQQNGGSPAGGADGDIILIW